MVPKLKHFRDSFASVAKESQSEHPHTYIQKSYIICIDFKFTFDMTNAIQHPSNKK